MVLILSQFKCYAFLVIYYFKIQFNVSISTSCSDLNCFLYINFFYLVFIPVNMTWVEKSYSINFLSVKDYMSSTRKGNNFALFPNTRSSSQTAVEQ